MTESDEGFDILLFPMIGVALGFSFASMANISPFIFAILAWIAVVFAFWKGISVISFMMYGVTFGSIIGAMANIIPYAFVVLGWIAIFFSMMIKPGQEIKPTTLVMTPLILMVIGGLAFTPYTTDFANTLLIGCRLPITSVQNICTGYADNWRGCINSCRILPVSLLSTLFSASIFSTLLSGDIVGFFGALFQTGSAGIFGFLSVIAGVILIFIGLGIGGGGSILGTGITFNVNDQGTRMAQSMGITLLAYGLVTLSFGAWFSILGGGWFGLNSILPIVFAGVIFYGGYLQGKSSF